MQNIGSIFWCKKYRLNFCASCKISGQFFTKYQTDIYNSLVNQTLWSQGTYQLEIISACSERSGQLPIQILFWGIDRFCWLLIGVKPTSKMCQYNRNHDSKHAHLLAFTLIHKFIHLTLIKALFLHLRGRFNTNQ